jgi:hypothetical protein
MIRPGNIVTDMDPESRFQGKQGEVEEVQYCFWSSPEILVRFERFLETFRPWQESGEDEKFVRFLYDELELRIDADWTPEMYAKRRFGDRFHSLRVYNQSLNISEFCMVDNCSHNQVKVVWINIWGTVMNVYVCDEHSKHYQVYSCGDSFPWRKRLAEKIPA